jgi:2,4-dienoyl-CoA reductase-like NADH-dependent reductase (Old Yellow Enzyme family)
MRYRTPGQHEDVAAFRTHLRGLDPAFDCVLAPAGGSGPLGREVRLGARSIGNRFATQPMEGWDAQPDGLPSAHTLRRWRRFGRSGAALIWGGEAFAVRADGRANPNQLYLNDDVDAERGLRALRQELLEGHREHGAGAPPFVGLQLTHSGRFARPVGALEPRVAYRHPVLDARFGVTDDRQVLTDGELEAIGGRFVDAARLAQRAGFDFVDVKCCHGYLLHELLGARARPGPYGGRFEGRTRLFARTVEAIRRACPELEIGVRVSIGDVFPHQRDPATGVGAPLGWDAERPWPHGFGIDADDPRELDLDEPLRFLALVRSLGIRLVNLTLGSPYYCPHLQRPATYPPSDGYDPPEDPLASVLRHLRTVRACKRAFPDLLLVGTGYSYLQEFLPHVAEAEVGAGHVDFVGVGRMLLSYPELPADLLAGRPLDKKRVCRTFSDCTTAPRNGLPSGCYPLDPYYKEMPAAQRLKAIKRGAKP